MKKNKRKIFLSQLEEIPIIKLACDKAGISRNTVYRWRKESKEFAEKMDKALNNGENNIDDLTNAQYFSLIKNGYWQAIKYRLEKSLSLHDKSMIQQLDEKTKEKRKILEQWQNMDQNKPE